MAEFGGPIEKVFENNFVPERAYGLLSQMIEDGQGDPSDAGEHISDLLNKLNLDLASRNQIIDAMGGRLAECTMKLYTLGFRDGIRLGYHLLSDNQA